MFTVQIAEFRNRLSAYLKRVRQGGEVVITDRDTPIGRLVPFKKGEGEELFEVIPPRNGFEGLSRMTFPATRKPLDIVELLIEDRKKR